MVHAVIEPHTNLDDPPMQWEICMQIWVGVSKGTCPQAPISATVVFPVNSADGAICCMQANGQQSQEPPADDRDAEMEEVITGAVRRDPLAAYDVDVALEGAAIDQYFALLQQQQASGGV